MAFQTGSVYARAGFHYDDSGAQRFERRLQQTRAIAKDDVTVDLNANVDERGFHKWGRELDKSKRQTRENYVAVQDLRSGLRDVGQGALGATGRIAGLSVGIGLATGAVAGLSSVLAPAVGALAVVPGFLGAVAQPAAVAAGAFQNVGEALKGNAEAMKKLTPEARSFVTELKGYKAPLEDLQRTAQRGLFPGLERGIHAAAKNLPVLKEITKSTADAMGDVAEKFGNFLGSK